MSLEVEWVRIAVEPARAQELIQLLYRARRGYLGAPHCQGVEIFLNTRHDEVAALIRWSSAAAHALAREGPHAGAFMQAVSALAAGPPAIANYEPVMGDGR